LRLFSGKLLPHTLNSSCRIYLKKDTYTMLGHKPTILRLHNNSTTSHYHCLLRAFNSLSKYTTFKFAEIILSVSSKNCRNALSILPLNERVDIKQGPVEPLGENTPHGTLSASRKSN
jgi:hypothetical protein